MEPPESTPTSSTSPSPPFHPELGHQYPFRIGKSIRNPDTSREFFAVKYNHIPDKVSLSQPSTLCHEQDMCKVQMPTKDGNSSVTFEGPCRKPDANRESTVDDFVLVFVDGVVWLERASYYYQNMQAKDGVLNQGLPMEYPEGMELEKEEEVKRDGDSWICSNGDEEEKDGPPSTHGRDGAVMEKESNEGRAAGDGMGGTVDVGERVGQGSMGSKTVHAKTVPRKKVGHKTVAGKTVGGRGPSNVGGYSGDRMGGTVDAGESGGQGRMASKTVPGKTVAHKTVARKTVARGGPSNIGGSSGGSSSEEGSDEDDGEGTSSENNGSSSEEGGDEDDGKGISSENNGSSSKEGGDEDDGKGISSENNGSSSSEGSQDDSSDSDSDSYNSGSFTDASTEEEESRVDVHGEGRVMESR